MCLKIISYCPEIALDKLRVLMGVEVTAVRLQKPHYFFCNGILVCAGTILLKKGESGKICVKVNLNNHLKLIKSAQVV